MLNLNVIVTEKMVRQRKGLCRTCGAKIHVGEYEDPKKGDEILTAWINLHDHSKIED